MLPYDFWIQVEKQLKHVLYGDTDSLYLYIPQDYSSIEESINETNKIADSINDIITNYFNSFLLPQLGVDPKYNSTFFKTELTAASILFLDTKKNYAYNLTSKKGKIYNPPKPSYTGVPIVKSDTTPFTKDLLKNLIEDIIFNKELTKKEEIVLKINEISAQKFNQLKECVEQLDFKYISVPTKWSSKDYTSEPSTIISMRTYNTLVNQEAFRPGGFGINFPITITNTSEFERLISGLRNKSKFYLENITLDKVNYLALPYNYSKDMVRKILEVYPIKIDVQTLWDWDRLAGNKVVRRILDLLKDHLNNLESK